MPSTTAAQLCMLTQHMYLCLEASFVNSYKQVYLLEELVAIYSAG